jgi:hypothetical protein
MRNKRITTCFIRFEANKYWLHIRTLGRGGGGGGGREEGGGEAEVQAAGARHQHPGRDPQQVGDSSVSL